MTCVLHYLFQGTQYDDVPVSGRPTEESSHGESDRRRTGCLIISSVLFAVDPADHFRKFGSQQEEADRVTYYRHSFPVVVYLEEDGIRNGVSTFKSERDGTLLVWKGIVREDGMSLFMTSQ